MAIILIKPVDTHLRGGDVATLSGIDVTDPVTIVGDFNSGGNLVKDVRRDLSGNCINNTDTFNLDLDTEQVRDVLATGRRLANIDAMELRIKEMAEVRTKTIQELAARLTRLGG